MFEKLKENLFNFFHGDKVQKINRMQRQIEKLEYERVDLEYDLVNKENELDDVDKKYEVSRKYIIEGAKKEFNGIDDYKKQQIIEKLTYLELGEVTYLKVIESISGISQIDLYNYSLDDSQDYSQSNMDRLYNMDNSKIINLYKGLESISSETWNEINANFFAEMVYKEGYGVERMVSQVEQEEEKRLENEKSLFGREQMEKYLKKNNISEELKNSHKFINLINANIGLECTCYQEKEFYESDFNDGSSPEEIYEFEHMYNLDEQKEIYKEFFDKQDKAYDNKEKYNFLLNLVNRDINKMVGRDIEKVDERFNDFQKFKTNKELQFEDGSIIKEGTSFIIEGLSSDVRDEFNYNIHFEEREGNIYNRENGTGEGYCLSEKKLVEFTELVEVEICDKMFIKDGVDFFGMLEKDLNLDDGSFIKKDTEFVIDGFRDGKYEIHFAKEEGNIYHNDFGDKYYFTSKEINQFAKVEEHEHGIAFDNIGIGGEFQLSVKELNIVAATDYDEIKSTIWSDSPGDNLFSLIYLENHGVNLDDYLKQYLKEVEESIAKNESFKSFGKYLSDDINDQLEAEYEKINDPWNNIDVKPFKEKIYERISADINKFSGAREIESFLQENKLKENIYIYYKDSPEEYRLISSIEELKEYIIDYMNEDDTFNEDVEYRWSNNDIAAWCECNDIEISKENPYKDIGDDYMMNPKREEKEIRKMISEHEKWIESKGARGTKLDLSNEDLKGIKLLNLDLRESSFKGADISDCIIYADLRGANLTGAKIDNTKFIGSNLNNTTIEANKLNLIEYQIKEESNKHKLGLKNLKTNKENRKENMQYRD